MKIGFDAKRALRNHTGLGNYSRLVIDQIARSGVADEITLYSPTPTRTADMKKLLSLPNVRVSVPAPPMSRCPSLWRTFRLAGQLSADGIELYHGLSNELPEGLEHTGTASVLTMHDVIYRRLPSCYTLPDRLLYDVKYSRSCRRADRIVAVSQRTRDDIVEIYGIDPGKIDVVYQGCDALFHTAPAPGLVSTTLESRGLAPGYVLQVGTVEWRKNLELTIRAMQALPGRHLVVVGRGGKYLDAMIELAADTGTGARTHFLTDVSTPELHALYHGAGVIAYPSRYEGFGIPVIEAIASRRPVVAATGSCLEEAGGPAPFYVDPANPRMMAEALAAALAGGPGIAARITAGVDYIRRFDTSAMGTALREVYARALEAKRGSQKKIQ